MLGKECQYAYRSQSIAARNCARAQMSAGNDDGEHVATYRASDVTAKVGLTRGGLVLIALMAGGDYSNVRPTIPLCQTLC